MIYPSYNGRSFGVVKGCGVGWLHDQMDAAGLEGDDRIGCFFFLDGTERPFTCTESDGSLVYRCEWMLVAWAP